ncbi:MAG: FkbM family methyltransferase [Janthinobacterium lividum]
MAVSGPGDVEQTLRLVDKASRLVKQVSLTPRYMLESARSIHRIEALLQGHMATPAAAPPVPVATPSPGPDAASPLQTYRGYEQEHLRIFQGFEAPDAGGSAGFITDFLGVRTRCSSIHDGAGALDGQRLGLPIPGDYHSETIEWLGLLRSVLGASQRFVALELGAGWGPWLVAGATAARRRGIGDIRLTAVEADAGHFESLHTHLRDNGLDPDTQTLIHAAVGAAEGVARWPKVVDHANNWGLRPARVDAQGLRGADVSYLGSLLDDFVEVRIVGVRDILEREPAWDLVHIDVQGAEAEICRAGLDLLQQRARWIVVGTHSRRLDGEMISLLHGQGFALEHEKPTRFAYRADVAELESMTLADGAQVWRNITLT